MLARPSTEIGTAKIHPSRGITVTGLHYWHESMRLADQSGKSVPVRYEPFNMGFVYAYIGGQWIECNADLFSHGHWRAEREGKLNFDEWREKQRQHKQKRNTIHGDLLGQI